MAQLQSGPGFDTSSVSTDGSGGLLGFGSPSAGGAVGDVFGAAGDFLKAYGSFQAEGSYTESAGQDIANAGLAIQKAHIQQAQIGRQLALTQGHNASTITGNGFELGGSGLDIMRSIAQEGALSEAVAGEQGLINQQGYLAQASAAKAAANQAGIAGGTGIAEGVGSLALLLVA